MKHKGLVRDHNTARVSSRVASLVRHSNNSAFANDADASKEGALMSLMSCGIWICKWPDCSCKSKRVAAAGIAISERAVISLKLTIFSTQKLQRYWHLLSALAVRLAGCSQTLLGPLLDRPQAFITCPSGETSLSGQACDRRHGTFLHMKHVSVRSM